MDSGTTPTQPPVKLEHAVDLAVATLQPYHQQAKAALDYVLGVIKKEQAPEIYGLVEQVAAKFDKVSGHYDGLVETTRKIVGPTTAHERDVLKGAYTGIKSRLLTDRQQAYTLLEELVKKHPDGERITEMYRKVRAFYDTVEQSIDMMKPARSQGLSEITEKSDAWYQRFPLFKKMYESPVWTIIGLAIGIVSAGIGMYLWRNNRQKQEVTGRALPRLQRYGGPQP